MIDDVERAVAEYFDDALGVGRPDPLDEARAQILGNAGNRVRRRGLELVGLELQAMRLIVDPLAERLDVFARDDGRQVADDGDQIAVLRRADLCRTTYPLSRLWKVIRSTTPEIGSSPFMSPGPV